MTEAYKYKISVIIPVYKVEDYLERCVDSVLEQTMDGVEIILVDDGSPDNCPEICDDYAEKHENIFVFHKTNGGLASARNAGIKNAHGKYIFFLDSDDWLDPDGLERLYTVAEETDVDFVKVRSIRTDFPNRQKNEPAFLEPIREMRPGLYTKEHIYKEIYPRLLATERLTLGPIVSAWGVLYRLSIIKDNSLFFDETIRLSEDILFSAQLLTLTKRFYYIDEAYCYHYCYNAKSISKSFQNKRWESNIKIIESAHKLFDNNKAFDFTDEIYFLEWYCILNAVQEGKYLNRKNRTKYYSELLKHPVIKSVDLHFNKVDVGINQKVIMLLVKLNMSKTLSYVIN